MQGGDYVAVARIIRPQGRLGEVACEMLSDFPERYRNLGQIFLQAASGPARAARVEKAWLHKGNVILKLAGVDSINQAEELRGDWVMVPRAERVPLSGNAYYVSDLAGCRVQAQRDGQWIEIGTVGEVEPTGGAPLLHVMAAGGEEILIPLAQEICRSVDVEAGIIRIDPPGELLELNADSGGRSEAGREGGRARKSSSKG